MIRNNLLMKSFCGGSRGAVLSKRAPLAAGGIGYLKMKPILWYI
jgi:hypothetical protein